MIKEIPDNIVMYLLNALYFKGEWSEKFKFDKSFTRDATFKKENGWLINIKMMSQNNTLPYYSDEYLSMTSLPFGNKAYSMVFILPKDIDSFSGMLNQLKEPGYLTDCIQSSNMREVDLFIPVFKTEYEIQLKETLEKLGMGIAFSKFADFSGISDASLLISEVKQKTFVSVDEKGAEAAAVTSINMCVTSIGQSNKVSFRADRPFLFAIRENSTGVVLFMGKIGKPE
jgi:serpin B